MICLIKYRTVGIIIHEKLNNIAYGGKRTILIFIVIFFMGESNRYPIQIFSNLWKVKTMEINNRIPVLIVSTILAVVLVSIAVYQVRDKTWLSGMPVCCRIYIDTDHVG